jgi:hypothetical protein
LQLTIPLSCSLAYTFFIAEHTHILLYQKQKSDFKNKFYNRVMRSAHFSKFTSSIAHLASNLLTAVGHFSSDGSPRIVQRLKSMPFQPQFYTKLISNNLLQTFSPEGDSLFSVFHKILHGIIIYIMRGKYIYLSYNCVPNNGIIA